METVDLGGHPVKAFKYKGDANQACTLANTTYNSQKIADLMANCGYTVEQAEQFVSTKDGSASPKDLTNLQENIFVLTSGHLPPNPAELVGSSRMEDLLASAIEASDYVIVDSPPVLLVADALSLSKQVDGVILAARMGHTTTNEAAETRQLLERVGAKMVGVVAGGVKEGKGYSHYGRSGYGYRYGHTYYGTSEG